MLHLSFGELSLMRAEGTILDMSLMKVMVTNKNSKKKTETYKEKQSCTSGQDVDLSLTAKIDARLQ